MLLRLVEPLLLQRGGALLVFFPGSLRVLEHLAKRRRLMVGARRNLRPHQTELFEFRFDLLDVRVQPVRDRLEVHLPEIVSKKSKVRLGPPFRHASAS